MLSVSAANETWTFPRHKWPTAVSIQCYHHVTYVVWKKWKYHLICSDFDIFSCMLVFSLLICFQIVPNFLSLFLSWLSLQVRVSSRKRSLADVSSTPKSSAMMPLDMIKLTSPPKPPVGLSSLRVRRFSVSSFAQAHVYYLFGDIYFPITIHASATAHGCW